MLINLRTIVSWLSFGMLSVLSWLTSKLTIFIFAPSRITFIDGHMGNSKFIHNKYTHKQTPTRINKLIQQTVSVAVLQNWNGKIEWCSSQPKYANWLLELWIWNIGVWYVQRLNRFISSLDSISKRKKNLVFLITRFYDRERANSATESQW